MLHHAPTAEDRAALAWVHSVADRVAPVKIDASFDASCLHDADVLWVHAPDAEAGAIWSPSEAVLTGLRAYVEQGGRMLCTNHAALLPHALDIEAQRPEVRTIEIRDRGFGRAYGFHSFRSHPLLADFFGGVEVWYPDKDRTEARVGYFDDAWPGNGRVIGIEKTYITLLQQHRLLIEHEAGQGRILSVGAFVHLARPNHRAAQLRHFLTQAFAYLNQPRDEHTPYWQPHGGAPAPFDGTSHPLPTPAPRTWTPKPYTNLALHRDPASDNFFDVAGRRCLMMGRERGGLDEVWVHPFRLLKNLEVGIVEGSSLHWLRDIPSRFEVRPEAITRTYRLGEGTLTETFFAAQHDPGGLLRFQAENTGPLELVLRFRTDFRWMWPYAPDTLGRLHYSYDTALHALRVHASDGDFYALFGGDLPPEHQLGGPFEKLDLPKDTLQGTPTGHHQLAQAFCYTLDASNAYTLHFAIAGSNQGQDEAEFTFRRLLTEPDRVYEEAGLHYAHLLAHGTMVTTPDETFNEAYRWAMVGTDRFWATTPGLGTGLMAGYGTTARGWHGGHAVSGRPGYAWYFGRDAAWACFAVNGYGDFERVRDQLDLFARFQDVMGKVFHEMSSSGVVHYDAADATPLYVILAAHYLRHAGDIDDLCMRWPSIQQAMRFLYATDTDEDGFIENTNVGHGWIEGGALFGAHTTLYLAGLWAQALREAAYLADVLGHDADAYRYRTDAADVVERIERDFWHEETQSYDYGKQRDGTFNPEQTILPAVLMHFRLLDPARVQSTLRAYASNGFSTDWGVRILPSESPLFNPQGYHYGSVWPLFTGWAALAEYAYGRGTQGFTHVMNNALGYRHWALGFIEEVLHGLWYEPGGVCAHQCWSETNVLHPIYAGLLGGEPDAPRHQLRLAPNVPLHWDTLHVENLHIGGTRLRLEMQRMPNETTYTFTRLEGPALTIAFAPVFPVGTCISEIHLNGQQHPGPDLNPNGMPIPPITFPLDDSVTVRFAHIGGIGMIPLVPQPEPGDASSGYRIIDAVLDGNAFTVTVEGRAGTTGRFQVRTFGPSVLSDTPVVVHPVRENGIIDLDVPFGKDASDYIRQTFTLHLSDAMTPTAND